MTARIVYGILATLAVLVLVLTYKPGADQPYSRDLMDPCQPALERC